MCYKQKLTHKIQKLTNCQKNLSHLNYLKNLEFFRHSSKFNSRGRFSHKEHSSNRNNFKFNNPHQNRQSQNFRPKRFIPPCRPIRGRYFNYHHNNNFHHSTDNQNSHKYNSCPVPQTSTQVSQPAICDANSS